MSRPVTSRRLAVALRATPAAARSRSQRSPSPAVAEAASATPTAPATASPARSSSSQSCGSCHALADAGTAGQIGPDLDAAFYESRRNGLGESTIVQVVRGQIAYPVVQPGTGAPGMPADIVTGKDADDVTAYVASVAGTVEPGSGTTGPPPTDGGDGGNGSADGASVFTSAGLRQLPHARGRRLDGQRRPEPRRDEAERGARARPRHQRPGRHAGIRRAALGRRRSQPWPTYVAENAGR